MKINVITMDENWNGSLMEMNIQKDESHLEPRQKGEFVRGATGRTFSGLEDFKKWAKKDLDYSNPTLLHLTDMAVQETHTEPLIDPLFNDDDRYFTERVTFDKDGQTYFQYIGLPKDMAIQAVKTLGQLGFNLKVVDTDNAYFYTMQGNESKLEMLAQRMRLEYNFTTLEELGFK